MEAASEFCEETYRRNRIRHDVLGNHFGFMQRQLRITQPFDLRAALAIHDRREAIHKKQEEWLRAGDAADAAADAGIVVYGDWRDADIFIDLYGMKYEEVIQLSKYWSLL
jgi:hypothetical protein